MLGQVAPTAPVTVSPSPTSTVPLNALFLVFALFAVALLMLFLLTVVLTIRNRGRRAEREAKAADRGRRSARPPIDLIEALRESVLGTETTEPRLREDIEGESRGLRPDTLTIGDLVMSPSLRNEYVHHARDLDKTASDEEPLRRQENETKRDRPEANDL
jgi:hypothetical protein